MWRSSWILAIAVVVSSIGQASAHCDMTSFDKTPPMSIVGDASDNEASFQYGSDFDKAGNIYWVWNFIRNTHDANSMSFNWEKAGLEQSVIHPLPPGEVACRKYAVKEIKDNDIDDDAPIKYGNRNRVQRAAIYGKLENNKDASFSFPSEIYTTYINEDGKKIEVEAGIAYTVSSDNIVEDISIYAPSDVYVGLSNATLSWSKDTITDLAINAEKQGAGVSFSTYKDFSGSALGVEAFFSPDEWTSRAVIAKGTIKGFGIGGTLEGVAPAKMTIFDEERKPIASTLVSFPITQKE